MIVVDASALLAIILGEPERETFRRAIRGARRCLISAVNVHEAATVLRGRTGGAGLKQLWHLLVANQFEVIAFDQEQVYEASEAFSRYGKGIHSKARLNLCDCAAYVLAKRMNAPLLFKGSDFAHTDLQSCL